VARVRPVAQPGQSEIGDWAERIVAHSRDGGSDVIARRGDAAPAMTCSQLAQPEAVLGAQRRHAHLVEGHPRGKIVISVEAPSSRLTSDPVLAPFSGAGPAAYGQDRAHRTHEPLRHPRQPAAGGRAAARR